MGKEPLGPLLFVTEEDIDGGRSLKTAAIGIPSPVTASVNPRRTSKGMDTSEADTDVLSKTGSGSIQGKTGASRVQLETDSRERTLNREWQVFNDSPESFWHFLAPYAAGRSWRSRRDAKSDGAAGIPSN